MLTNQDIINGYATVLHTVVPTLPQQTYWLATLSRYDLPPEKFPVVLANQILADSFYILSATGVELATLKELAGRFLVYEPTDDVLAVMANWTKPPLERVTFSTDVMTSRNGTEQRIRHWAQPRTIYEYDFLLFETDLNHFQNQVYNVQGKYVYIPLWHQMRKLGEGLNSVPFMHAGQYMLYRSYRDYELVTVLNVAGEFFFEHQVQMDTDYSTWIIPVEKGSIRDRLQFSLLTAKVATGSIQAIMAEHTPLRLPYSNSRFPNLVVGETTYPVFGVEPNWTTALGLNFTRPTTVLDFGGKTTAYDLHNYSDLERTGSFLCNRNTYSIRDFFLDMQGKFKSFYMPSFQNDLDVIELTRLDATTRLTVTEVGFSISYSKGIIKHLLLEFKSKPAIITAIKVAPISTSNGTEEFEIELLPADIFLGDIAKVSFVTLTRFTTDALELNWITPDWYTTTTSFLGIK